MVKIFPFCIVLNFCRIFRGWYGNVCIIQSQTNRTKEWTRWREEEEHKWNTCFGACNAVRVWMAWPNNHFHIFRQYFALFSFIVISLCGENTSFFYMCRYIYKKARAQLLQFIKMKGAATTKKKPVVFFV